MTHLTLGLDSICQWPPGPSGFALVHRQVRQACTMQCRLVGAGTAHLVHASCWVVLNPYQWPRGPSGIAPGVTRVRADISCRGTGGIVLHTPLRLLSHCTVMGIKCVSPKLPLAFHQGPLGPSSRMLYPCQLITTASYTRDGTGGTVPCTPLRLSSHYAITSFWCVLPWLTLAFCHGPLGPSGFTQ